LERAHLREVLGNEREGLETLVGERGVRLSGGQRQRLGIARALYTRPKLLVLDEATSSLDVESESLIVQTINEMKRDVTLLIVAHRLSTVRTADLFAYIDQGHLVAYGDYHEVQRLVPAFNRQTRMMGLS